MKLRIVDGPNAGREIELEGEGSSVGRGRDNDLVLPGEGISRRHARVEQRGEEWVIHDLESVNGIKVNGERIKESCPISPGDDIEIFNQHLILSDGPAVAAATPLPTAATEAQPEAPPVQTEAPPVQPEAAAQPKTNAEKVPPQWHEPDPKTRRRIPWGRVAVLLILLGLIGGAVYLLALRPDSPGQAGAAESAAEGEAAEAVSGGPPREISDDELASLIAEEEESGPGPGQGSATPGETVGAVDRAGGTGRSQDPGAPPQGLTDDERGRVTEEGRAVASDVVFVASDPPGATVSVDGQERGVTPLLVRDLAQGRHRVVLRKQGYEEFERQIHVPDLLPAQAYVLRQQPATLRVESSMPGTAVWRGPQLLGVAPDLITSLEPGVHQLTFVAPGCEGLRKTVSISGLRGETLEVSPARLLGALELITLPTGCEVTVGAGITGVTLPGEDDTPLSAPLRFDHLRPGTYSVKVAHPAGVETTGKLPVKPGETLRKTVKIWVPDTRLVLADGADKVGMLVDRNEQGDVVLAESPRKLERYLKPQIERVVRLDLADIRRQLQQDTGQGDREGRPAPEEDQDRDRQPGEDPDTWPEAPGNRRDRG